MATNSIYLINKYNAWGIFFALLEHISNTTGTNSNSALGETDAYSDAHRDAHRDAQRDAQRPPAAAAADRPRPLGPRNSMSPPRPGGAAADKPPPGAGVDARDSFKAACACVRHPAASAPPVPPSLPPPSLPPQGEAAAAAVIAATPPRPTNTAARVRKHHEELRRHQAGGTPPGSAGSTRARSHAPSSALAMSTPPRTPGRKPAGRVGAAGINQPLWKG